MSKISLKLEIDELIDCLCHKLDQDQLRHEEDGHQAILEWQNAFIGQHTEDCQAYFRIFNEYRCFLNFNFHECDIRIIP